MRMPIDPGRVRPTSGDRLKPNDIDRIVAELKSWSKPKVTWNVVVAAVADRLKPRRFSRQALQDKPEIYRAYAKAKEAGRIQDIPTNHNPRFAPVLHPTLEAGVEAMVVAAQAWLAAPRA